LACGVRPAEPEPGFACALAGACRPLKRPLAAGCWGLSPPPPPSWGPGPGTRRLNWTEAISRAQWAPTKEPSLLNQRLGTIHGGAGEARGAGGWVTDPPGHAKPGHAKPDYAECGRVPGCGRGAPPAGAGSQLGPNRSPGGLVGPRVRFGGRGGGQQGYFKPHNIKGDGNLPHQTDDTTDEKQSVGNRANRRGKRS
jgi:hypothetical protein